MSVRWCEQLFQPRSVAVVGAGSRSASMGSRYLTYLRSYGFAGSTYAVSRRRPEDDGGSDTYERILDLPEPVDLCQIAVPYANVPDVVADCVTAGVAVVQVLTAPEPTDAARTATIRAALQGSKTRLVGPNCVGIHSPHGGVTFLPGATRDPGSVSLVSQSGGLTADFVRQADSWGVGLRNVVSIGNCLDAGVEEFVAYLASDIGTASIGLYLEGVSSGPAFLTALANAAANKPVFVLKGGRSPTGGTAASTHTGAVAGDYQVWKAVLEEHGAILLDSPSQLLNGLAATQARVSRPGSNRAALVGNGGGMTVLMSDCLEACGMELAELTAETKQRIAATELPAGSVSGSATDIPGGAISRAPELLRAMLASIAADPGVGVIFAHFNLSALAVYDNREQLVENLTTMLRETGCIKPVFVGLRATGEATVESLRHRLVDSCAHNGVPCFPSGTEAIEAASLAVAASTQRATMAMRQATVSGQPTSRLPAWSDPWKSVAWRDGDPPSLGYDDVSRILTAYGIPQAPGLIVQTAQEAATFTQRWGFPVVLKVEAPTLLHKTEHQAIRLDIGDLGGLFRGFADLLCDWDAANGPMDGVLVQRQLSDPVAEILVGARQDPNFGPVLVVGTGGVLVELIRDLVVRTAPLSRDTARQAVQALRLSPMLDGYRGGLPADVPALLDLIQGMSRLASRLPQGVEAECNPVIVNKQGMGAFSVDCRIIRRPI